MLDLLRLPGTWIGYASLIVAALGSIGLGGMLKTWLDYRFRGRKQSDDMATAIVASTTDRLRMAERHGRICEANLAYIRHRHNNLSGSYDSLLLFLEVAPEKLAEFLPRIREKRRLDLEGEAAERAALMAQALVPDDDPPEEVVLRDSGAEGASE
jgi:hypothetical protein